MRALEVVLPPALEVRVKLLWPTRLASTRSPNGWPALVDVDPTPRPYSPPPLLPPATEWYTCRCRRFRFRRRRRC